MADFYRDTLWPAVSSNNQFNAVLQAAEQAIEGTIGSVRTGLPGFFSQGGYDGISDEKLGADVLVNVQADVRLMGVARSPAIAPEIADRSVEKVTLRFRLSFSTPVEIEAANRRAARAACWTLMDACAAALAWPGNLRQTQAGDETDLVGHALCRSGEMRVVREDWDKRVFIAEWLMTGNVNVERDVA